MNTSLPTEVFRYCPRCGSSSFEVVSDRSFRCRSCDFNYYINSAAAVAALIFDSEGRLLVTRRAVDPDKGKLDLPGGFIDPGESAEEAVRRELQEELGIVAGTLRFLESAPNRYLFSGLTVFTTDLAFRVNAEIPVNMKASDDISGFEWIFPEDADPLDIPAPSIRYFIKEVAPRCKIS